MKTWKSVPTEVLHK